MKTYLFGIVACICLFSCKKDSSSSANIQVKVSELTSKTTASIKIIDVTKGNAMVFDMSGISNGTYTGSQVTAGDQIQVTASANMNDDLAGDGDGIIQYYFNGELVGGHGGQVDIGGYTQTETIPNP